MQFKRIRYDTLSVEPTDNCHIGIHVKVYNVRKPGIQNLVQGFDTASLQSPLYPADKVLCYGPMACRALVC